MTKKWASAAALALLVSACAMMGERQDMAVDSKTAIATRQAAMKAIGAASAPLRSSNLDAATARAVGSTINSNLKIFAANLPTGSGAESGTATKARPEIWTGSPGFNNALNIGLLASEALANTSGDAAAIQAQAGAVMNACAGCHTVYRAA
jgi:cytochrome c556